MGYFVQVTGDAGSPVFQAFKNYPDVSFASSALFHALITASLEHGFVPSVLRAQDASIALAVHGTAGSRLSIALVTSEFSAGQTRDIEAQLHWRLRAIYRGALIAVGGELLRRQPVDALRRALAQRLAPMVARVMADEPLPGAVGRVPRLGLATSGAAAEWLPASAAADNAFERLVASLPAGGGVVLAGLSPNATDSTLAVLSWQGRALSATFAWRRLDSVDRALLLFLADEVGPASFEQPARSWALEAVDRLWLPSAAAAVDMAPAVAPSPASSPSASPNGKAAAPAGGVSEDDALLPIGVPLRHSASTSLSLRRHARRHRMVSVRIYPTLEASDMLGDELVQHGVGSSVSSSAPASPRGPPLASGGEDGDLPRSLIAGIADGLDPEEVAAAWSDEASLVFTVVVPEEDDGGDEGGGARSRIVADDLQQSAELCGASLQELWKSLRAPPARRALLAAGRAEVVAAVLLDEATQDAVVAPAGWHASQALPWRCPRRRAKAEAVRRLLYWLHTLPPLSEQKPQQYVCCEDYAVGALRREDGLQCWALVHLQPEAASAQAAASDGASPPSVPPPPVLHAVAELMSRVPVSGDLRMGFGAVL